jgi:hypothetical protein
LASTELSFFVFSGGSQILDKKKIGLLLLGAEDWLVEPEGVGWLFCFFFLWMCRLLGQKLLICCRLKYGNAQWWRLCTFSKIWSW